MYLVWAMKMSEEKTSNDKPVRKEVAVPAGKETENAREKLIEAQRIRNDAILRPVADPYLMRSWDVRCGLCRKRIYTIFTDDGKPPSPNVIVPCSRKCAEDGKALIRGYNKEREEKKKIEKKGDT